MTGSHVPTRHTCHDQTTADGPSWLCPHCGPRVATEEECQQVAQAVLERGYVATTVYGDDLEDDEQAAELSPGRFQLPPGTEGRYPRDFLERLNTPKPRP